MIVVFQLLFFFLDLLLCVLHVELLYELSSRQALVIYFLFTQRFVDRFSLTIQENEDNNSKLLFRREET